jgi:hypothetical protein
MFYLIGYIFWGICLNMNYNKVVMIDWYHLAVNALWICALAMALATLSYASWVSGAKHQKVRDTLALPSYQTSINIACMLFSLGLAGNSDKWWEITLWLLIAILFLWIEIRKIYLVKG